MRLIIILSQEIFSSNSQIIDYIQANWKEIVKSIMVMLWYLN